MEWDSKLKLEQENISVDNNLEDFIKKISNIIEDKKTSSGNINVAISKLQLMYFVQDHNYLNLINMYSKLSDSYNKLVKLEKINKIPITSKPVILTLIDKLFINNLTSINTNLDDTDTEEDDLDNYSNMYDSEDEESVSYKNSNSKSKNIIKNIEYKLFDGLKFEKNSSPEFDQGEQNTVVFDTEGKIIS